MVWWWRRRRRYHAMGSLVAVRTATELLVVQPSYRPRLGLPGGGIDAGETPRQTACRELQEEVGMAVDAADLASLGAIRGRYMDCRSTIHLFEYRVSAMPAVTVDGREIVWAGAVRPSSFPRQRRDLALRAYLRRFAPDLLSPAALRPAAPGGRRVGDVPLLDGERAATTASLGDDEETG
ncbi:MAG: NUDIX hydrolase [Pseudomonadota bacterium]